MVGRICWKNRFWASSEREKEWSMTRVGMMTEMSWEVDEEVNQRQEWWGMTEWIWKLIPKTRRICPFWDFWSVRVILIRYIYMAHQWLNGYQRLKGQNPYDLSCRRQGFQQKGLLLRVKRLVWHLPLVENLLKTWCELLQQANKIDLLDHGHYHWATAAPKSHL